MIIEIKKTTPPHKLKEIIAMLSETSNNKSLRKHFGKLKRGLDGLSYQKKVRNEWP